MGSGQTQPCDLQRAATTLLHLTARFAPMWVAETDELRPARPSAPSRRSALIATLRRLATGGR